MSKQGSGGDTFWLWDGELEYEGRLISAEDGRLTARIRTLRRWTLAAGAPGRPIPLDLLERQRRLAQRACFGQSPAVLLGALVEFHHGTLQPSSDREFDYVVSGTFAPVADEHLDALSQLSSDGAHQYLQARRASGTFGP